MLYLETPAPSEYVSRHRFDFACHEGVLKDACRVSDRSIAIHQPRSETLDLSQKKFGKYPYDFPRASRLLHADLPVMMISRGQPAPPAISSERLQ